MNLTLKEKIITAVAALPADMTSEDAIEQIILIQKVERGLQAMKDGKSINQKEAKERVLNKWQK